MFVALPSNYPPGLCHKRTGKEFLHSQLSLSIWQLTWPPRYTSSFKQPLSHFLVSLPIYQLSIKWEDAYFSLHDLLHRPKFGITLFPWWLPETDTLKICACRLWLLACIFQMVYSDLGSKEITAVIGRESLSSQYQHLDTDCLLVATQ